MRGRLVALRRYDDDDHDDGRADDHDDDDDDLRALLDAAGRVLLVQVRRGRICVRRLEL